MKSFAQHLAKAGLKILSVIAPPIAGKQAARAFAATRNDANPQRKAFTPIGARAIGVTNAQSKVNNIYMWGKSGEIVLLVHGWGADCGSMFGLVQPLLNLGYRVATFDGPAHGASEGNRTTMAEYVLATREAIEQLESEQLESHSKGKVSKVVAHSLGGIVAMAALKHYPAIRQLALISAPCSLTDVLDIWSKGYMSLSKRVKQHILAQLFKDNGVPVSHWDITLHGQAWQGDALVLHDEQDPIVHPRHAARIAKILPNSTLALFSGLGHVKILTDKSVHHTISAFFQSSSVTNELTAESAPTTAKQVEHEY